MDALNKTITRLQEKKEALEEQKRKVEDEQSSIDQELFWLEQERLKLSKRLSKEDEQILKRELTAVGELLELSSVIVASLQVVQSGTEDPKDLYAIDIETGVTFDTGVVGLCVKVTIKTESPRVEEIIKEMFEQEGYISEKIPLSWECHWDYNTRIRLKKREN
jgi:hypothetical protein